MSLRSGEFDGLDGPRDGDGAGSIRGIEPALHQPPNASDLLRSKPADAGCAQVRGLLRDFADQDLHPEELRLVDDHVHGCRTCSVELARAEHEVLRLRRAFEAIRSEEQSQPGGALPADFSVRVVEQLVLADGACMNPGDSASIDEGPVAPARASFLVSPAGVLVAGLFALFVLAVGMRVLVDDAAELDRVARLEIMYADEVFGLGRRPLSGGDVLGETQGLWVGRGGAALMDWHDLSERIQPAASIEIHDGELQFKDGAPLLMGGKVLVATNRDVEVPMADGSRLALGVGEYSIAAIPVDMHDDQAFLPVDESVLPGDIQLEVEVHSGEPAVVLRGGVSSQVIAVGSTGRYSGGGSVSITAAGPAAGGQGEGRTPVPPASEPPLAVIAGHVAGPNGQPGVGARVWLQYAASGTKHTGSQVTGANGSFAVPTEEECSSSFAIALSLPSELRPDLGMTAVDAVPVSLNNGLAQLRRSLNVGHSVAVIGRAVDEFHVPLSGVSVIPCIVDELFGSVSALTAMQTWSTATGGFKVEQLPAVLPHHQRLVLALSHPNHEAVIAPVPERGSAAAHPDEVVFVVPSLRSVSFHGLPPNVVVTLLEEVPGLPLGSAAVRRTFTTTGAGVLPFVSVGRGALWMRSDAAANARVTEMIMAQVGSFTIGYPAATSSSYEQRFRHLQPLPGTDLKVVNSYRHQVFEVAPIANVVESQFLHVVDSFGQEVVHAQVFAIRQSACFDQPDPRFLGFTAQDGQLSIDGVKPYEDVFVIGPGGGLAWLSRPAVNSAGSVVTTPLQPTGRVLLAPSLRPDPAYADRVVTITFRRSQEMLVGMTPEAVRFAAYGNWEVGGLPAGSYFAEVGGQTHQVVVPSTGFVVLGGQ